MLVIVFSVVLMTGNSPNVEESAQKSAEIYNPLTKTSCSVPQLPEGRHYHTQNGDLACGGGASQSTRSTCVKWSPASGTWIKSHTLRQLRAFHVSWETASGVYLIGGYHHGRTSEKVKVDGSVEEGFKLKYYTR